MVVSAACVSVGVFERKSQIPKDAFQDIGAADGYTFQRTSSD